MESTIKLFNAMSIRTKRRKKASKKLMNATIKRGFIFAPEVVANYSEQDLLKITPKIGSSSDEMN